MYMTIFSSGWFLPEMGPSRWRGLVVIMAGVRACISNGQVQFFEATTAPPFLAVAPSSELREPSLRGDGNKNKTTRLCKPRNKKIPKAEVGREAGGGV